MSNVTRPSSSSNYDERFVVPLEASRRGAHRARVSPVMTALPVVVVAGIVLGAIFLVYTYFGGLSGSDAGSDATTTVSPTSSSSGTEASSTPTESGSESPTGSSGAAAGEVDKTITVDLYNGTKPLVSGLARKVAPKITNAGWTTGRIETWTGTPVTVTTIYYGTSDQKATAQALAKALGRGTVKLSPGKAGGAGHVAVVVGNDYPGAGRSTKNSDSTRSSTATRTSSGSTTKPSRTTPSQTSAPTETGGDPSPLPSS